MAFNGQVVLIHGNTRYFHMDTPLNESTGSVLANFTNMETFGARNTHWLKATINSNNPNLFSFECMMVPANIDK